MLSIVMSKTDMLLLTNPQNNLLGFTQVDRFEHEAVLDYVVYDPDKMDMFLGSVSF